MESYSCEAFNLLINVVPADVDFSSLSLTHAANSVVNGYKEKKIDSPIDIFVLIQIRKYITVISNNGFMDVTIIISSNGNIIKDPLLTIRGLPIYDSEEFKFGLQEKIFEASKNFSLTNKKQESNLIDAIKVTCRKYSREKTGKKPLTNINLVRV